MDDVYASRFFSDLRAVRATMAEYATSVDAFMTESACLCSQSREAIDESRELLSKLQQFRIDW